MSAPDTEKDDFIFVRTQRHIAEGMSQPAATRKAIFDWYEHQANKAQPLPNND